MKYSQYKTIEFSQDGGVLTMRLNRPEAMNAVDKVMHEELSRVFSDIAADRSVHAVVMTGNGRGFCAGGDINWIRDITPDEVDALFREARKIIIDMLELPQPIIAAVNGAAAGLGATLALFCDMVYAADGVRISDPHVRVGVAAGDGGAVIWPLLVGPVRAKQYLMTGDALTAAEAERIALINQVLPQQQLLDACLGMAARLATGPRMAITATKVSVNKILRDTANLVLDTSLALEKECFFSDDHKEAVRAFAERRQPEFSGR